MMKNVKTLTALLFITIIIFFLTLVLALLFIAAAFKTIDVDKAKALTTFLALVLPLGVICITSLILYFVFRNKVNKLEQEEKDNLEETKNLD